MGLLLFLLSGVFLTANPYQITGITDTAAATHPWLSQTHTYGYDLADRLLTATQATPGNNTFAYDKLDNATKRYYPEGEHDLVTGQKLVYMPDHLGSVRDAINATTGALAFTADYEPDGFEWRSTTLGTAAPPAFRYAGMHWHPQLKKYLTRYRIYDQTGPYWLSRDPIGETGGINLYAYVGGNPTNATDRLGLRSSVNKDGSITIQPEDPTVPSMTIGPVLGAQGVSPTDTNFHQYSVSTQSSGACDLGAVGGGLASSPTPGPGNGAAMPGGTVNDAGPIIPSGTGSNYVNTVLRPGVSPNETDIVINYTIGGGHILGEGFVIRWGTKGPDGSITLRSYGEGNSWMQSPLLRPIWQGQVDQVWGNNQSGIFKKAGCSCR